MFICCSSSSSDTHSVSAQSFLGLNPSLQQQQGGVCYFSWGKDNSFPQKMLVIFSGGQTQCPEHRGKAPESPKPAQLYFLPAAGGWLVISEGLGGGYWGFLFLSHRNLLGSAAFHAALSLLCIISILKRLCPRYLFISKMPRQLRKQIQTVFLLLCFRVSPFWVFFLFQRCSFLLL